MKSRTETSMLYKAKTVLFSFLTKFYSTQMKIPWRIILQIHRNVIEFFVNEKGQRIQKLFVKLFKYSYNNISPTLRSLRKKYLQDQIKLI